MNNDISHSTEVKDSESKDDESCDLLLLNNDIKPVLHNEAFIKHSYNEICTAVAPRDERFQKRTQLLASNYMGEPVAMMHPWRSTNASHNEDHLRNSDSKIDDKDNGEDLAEELYTLPDPALVKREEEEMKHKDARDSSPQSKLSVDGVDVKGSDHQDRESKTGHNNTSSSYYENSHDSSSRRK